MDQKSPAESSIWPRPMLVPVPDQVADLHDFTISLDGSWKFTAEPPVEYWRKDTDVTNWDDVTVPAELFALGYDIQRDMEYVYSKRIDIPAHWSGSRIILKTGMAYEYSKVWVNGVFVRDHKGGYTSYDCDITKYVEPGQPAQLTVMCMNRHDCIVDWPFPKGVKASGYAGLIDHVKLVALPRTHLLRLHYETDFDDSYTDGTLEIITAVHFDDISSVELEFSLIDPNGRSVEINPAKITIDKTKPDAKVLIPVTNPLKWDAEHPNLYKLSAVLKADGKILQANSVNVGFRKVERKGKNLYVNGVRTKLRGAARYSHHPILGKTFSCEQLESEIKALKYGNMNFIRSSAYPEREKLYELCDIYGVYVEECAPANFQRGNWDSQKDMTIRNTSDVPYYKADYMDQFAEMIERDRSHPSIIIWEYANESDWGVNFQAELDYIAAEAPSRMTAGTWNNKVTSLASYHYPDYNEVFDNAGIYDEYAHVATHALKQIKRDPNIRNAWGLSIQKGWEALYEADGVVGTAIFAMGDFTIFRPDGSVFGREFGQWGLIDTWLREKPELWLVKKAYSPVRIRDKYVDNPGSGMKLCIPVKNRYNNTNLNELIFKWNIGSEQGTVSQLDVNPGHKGLLELPARQWKDGETVEISIYEESGMLVDKYALVVCTIVPENAGVQDKCRLKGADADDSAARQTAPSVRETEHIITVLGKDFSIDFDKRTGLISSGKMRGYELIKSGPYLNMHGMYYKSSIFQNDRKGEFSLKASGWKGESIDFETEGNAVVVHITGKYPGAVHRDMWGFERGYEQIGVQFSVRVDGSGLITTDYTIENPPAHPLNEVGVFYVLTDDIDRLTWEREAQYSVYPEDHIGRPSGTAKRYRGYGRDTYRVKPEWSWAYDEANFVYYGGGDPGGHGTNDFLASRENIYYAAALPSGSDAFVLAESDVGSVSVRVNIAKDEDEGLPHGVMFTINNQLFYDLGHGSNPSKTGDGYLGNYTYPEIHLKQGHTGSVKMKMTSGGAKTLHPGN